MTDADDAIVGAVDADELEDADAETTGDSGADAVDGDAADASSSDDADDDDDDDDDRVTQPTASADVLEFLVKSLVEDPDSVEVEVDTRGRRPTLNVHVADGDMGRIIGRRGHIAQSIRRVTRAAAVKDGTEINIEFID